MSIIKYLSFISLNAVGYRACNVWDPTGVGIPGLAFVTIGWMVYLEFEVKGLFIRPNCQGEKSLCPLSIIEMWKWPFTTIEAWRPTNWDLNYYTVMGGVLILEILPRLLHKLTIDGRTLFCCR